MNRQEAYKIVQSNAMRAWEQRTPYLDLLAEDPAVTAHLSREELEAAVRLQVLLMKQVRR